jgi:hypothetical protein
MARKRETGTERSRSGNAANLDFEETLWAAADKMRGHTDAAKCNDIALGLRLSRMSSVRSSPPSATPFCRKLMSGEIRGQAAEKMMERAL